MSDVQFNYQTTEIESGLVFIKREPDSLLMPNGSLMREIVSHFVFHLHVLRFSS